MLKNRARVKQCELLYDLQSTSSYRAKWTYRVFLAKNIYTLWGLQHLFYHVHIF